MRMRMNRRQFSGMAMGSIIAPMFSGAAAAAADLPSWYKRTRRWGQINLTEDNAGGVDLAFWRDYWRRTVVQGMMLNAGGQVAYYPTQIDGHRRAPALGSRDLFGELLSACRDDGLAVMARLSYTASADLLRAHPDWASIDANGHPLPMACMNSGFIYDYCSSIVREIATAYRPDAFTLSGWGSNTNLCYCDTCRQLFHKRIGRDLPKTKDWNDPLYRDWTLWNSDRVMTLWDHQNSVAQAAGGADCLWIGQLIGGVFGRDTRRICERSKIVMVDGLQGRSEERGFQEYTDAAKVLRSVLGPDKPAYGCQGLWYSRMGSRPTADGQLWMYEGMAGGIVPWWHNVSAYNYDKRRYAIPVEPFNWHKANEAYLFDRTPVANVGVVWSEDNTVFYGRDTAREAVHAPWRGMVNALVKARIPYVAVHADYIDRDAKGLSTLVLPNLAAMTDKQAAAVRRFVKGGGGLVATGDTSLFNRFGDRRSDFALADIFGAHWLSDGTEVTADPGYDGLRQYMLAHSGVDPSDLKSTGMEASQSYFLLSPELRRLSPGPHSSNEPVIAPGTKRHPAFVGLDETDIVWFGGRMSRVKPTEDAQTLMTFVPPVPMAPPEKAYVRKAPIDAPGLIVNERPGTGRVAFMPADLDRQHDRSNHPDHARILANLVRWAARDPVPLEVEGPGLLDCNLYAQPGRMVLHVVNLNNVAAWKAPLEEFLPVGPIKVRVKLNPGVSGKRVRMLVAGRDARTVISSGWAEIDISQISHHEVTVIW